MSNARACPECGQPLDNRRADAIYCGQRCRRRADRRAERRARSYYTGPPAGTADHPGQDQAGERWRCLLERHEQERRPLSAREKELVALQRRNLGVLLPGLAQRQAERELERLADEQAGADRAALQAIAVEDRLNPSTLGSLARRAILSRTGNKPADPYTAILRPGHRSGPRPLDDEPQCIDKSSIGWR